MSCVTPLTWPTSTSYLSVKIVNLTFEQIKYGMCLLTPCTSFSGMGYQVNVQILARAQSP